MPGFFAQKIIKISKVEKCAFLILASVFIASSAQCAFFCESSFEDIWKKLRLAQQLGEMDSDRDINCGPVCAFNIFQAALLKRGNAPIKNSKDFLLHLVQKDELDSNGSSPRTIALILQKLFESEALAIPIELKVIRGPIRRHIGPKPPEIPVDAISVSDLAPTEKNLKIGFFKILDEKGYLVTMHASIIKSQKENKLTLIDPNLPNIDLSLTATKSRKIEGVDVPCFIFDAKLSHGIHEICPYAVLSAQIDAKPSSWWKFIK